MRAKTLSAALVFFILVGCAGTVDVTKTVKGAYNSTNPNDVEILMTRPEKSYVELGSVTANNFRPGNTAEMHNAIRAKAAPLGADAVILTNQGIMNNGWAIVQWATGVAIRYTTEGTQK